MSVILVDSQPTSWTDGMSLDGSWEFSVAKVCGERGNPCAAAVPCKGTNARATSDRLQHLGRQRRLQRLQSLAKKQGLLDESLEFVNQSVCGYEGVSGEGVVECWREGEERNTFGV